MLIKNTVFPPAQLAIFVKVVHTPIRTLLFPVDKMKLSYSSFISASFAALATSECITPNGLHRLEESGSYEGIEGALFSGEGPPYLFLPLAEPFIAQLVKAETPIQFRLAQIHGSTGEKSDLDAQISCDVC